MANAPLQSLANPQPKRSLKKDANGFGLVEILPAMLILMIGLLAEFVLYSNGLRQIAQKEERAVSSLISQNYIVALKAYSVKHGFERLADNTPVGCDGLTGVPAGDTRGRITLIDAGVRKITDMQEVSESEAPFFYKEHENSSGAYSVRILFDNVPDKSGNVFEKFFRITVRHDATGQSYDYFTSIGKHAP